MPVVVCYWKGNGYVFGINSGGIPKPSETVDMNCFGFSLGGVHIPVVN